MSAATRQRVYITGGSSGIGLALACLYAERGDDVTLLARDQARLESAVSLCEARSNRDGQTIAAVALDITVYDRLHAELDEVVAAFGLPDLLILSAGVAINKRFLDTPKEEFDWIVDINFAGSREVARCLLPGMLARGSGQIAFISSSAGLLGIYGYSAYAASKFAVTGFVQALRQELSGSGVSAHLVCPPEVDTPMIAAESANVLPQTRFLKDLAGTLPPAVAAKKIARGIRKKQAVIVPGVRASVILWCARHFQDTFGRVSELLLRWKF